MARKKINVGDWVIAPHGQTFQVAGLEDDCNMMAWGTHNGGYHCYHIANLTKLPASPATIAKSHQMLMRWWRKWQREGSAYDYEPTMANHCRRIANGGRK
jgi:hypothetical protein